MSDWKRERGLFARSLCILLARSSGHAAHRHIAFSVFLAAAVVVFVVFSQSIFLTCKMERDILVYSENTGAGFMQPLE